MIDIEKAKDEIVKSLLPLNPNKIILFGSYANNTANEDSDIDLFIIKDDIDDFVDFEIDARRYLRNFILNSDTNGVDILSATNEYLKKRNDYFYQDILKNGKVLYERNISS